MNDDQTITVAVVEDDAAVRSSLVEIITGEAGLRCVAACGSAEDAIATLPGLKPQVVLMDVSLPGLDGVGCVRALTDRATGMQVMMLTVHDNTDVIFDALAAGACGYLLKPIRAAALVEAVRDVVAGGAPMTSNIARRVVQAFKKPVSDLPGNTGLAELTAREREILGLLAKGYQYKEIADQTATSYHTVHAHIRRIYEKLQVRSRAQAVSVYVGRKTGPSGDRPVA
jgi:DNA-binding NarL/FixJ family response regulator